MQTKIAFRRRLDLHRAVFHRENMHHDGATSRRGPPQPDLFKEGQADLSECYNNARMAANAVGGEGSAACDAAFEASLVARFATNYNCTSTTVWNTAPQTRRRPLLGGPPTPARAARTWRCGDSRQGRLSTPPPRRSRPPTAAARCSRSRSPIYRVGATKGPRLPRQAGPVLQDSGRGTRRTGARRRPATSRRSPDPASPASGYYDADGGCSAYGADQSRLRRRTCPPTLALALGTPAVLRPVRAGRGPRLRGDRPQRCISSAGDAALSVTNPRARRPVTWSTARSASRGRLGLRRWPGAGGPGGAVQRLAADAADLQQVRSSNDSSRL